MEYCNMHDAIRNTYLDHQKEKTLKHVEEVAETAVQLAVIHNLDQEKTRLAALLHDVSAVITPQAMYDLAVSRKLPLDPAEEKYHFLLHQRISRILSEEQFGIRDPDILDAVECHTTLKKNAGMYDKVIFIADKISWDQEGLPPYYDTLKRLAEKSLDEACFFYISWQFDHNLLLMPHRWIMEAREDLRTILAKG